MPSYIQNYGFTKTLFKDNDNNEFNNIVKWKGNYDGKRANIDVDINDNGHKELVSMQLNNDDIRNMFGIQPVEVSLEKRLAKDFLYKPITLEGALTKRKIYNYRKKLQAKNKNKNKSKSKTKIKGKRRIRHSKTRKIYYN